MDDVRKKGVMVKLINLSPDLSEYFHRFGIHSDKSTEEVKLFAK